MAIRLPPRNYLTLPELAARWSCSENDLKELIVSGLLKPSYIINHVAKRVRFHQESSDTGPYWCPEPVETYVLDDDGKTYDRLSNTEGAYYLLHPDETSALDCTFHYFSHDRDHVQGPDDQNICFMVTMKDGEYRSITLEMVFKKGMVMLEEVIRFEKEQINDAPAEEPLRTRERNTLLSIIGALCQEAKIDYSKHAKSARIIQGVADKMGLKIGESTIEGHLKKVAQAVENNKKLGG